MFFLQRVLRFIILCYALYSFAIGIWVIIQAEDLCLGAAEDRHTIEDIEEFGTAIPVSKSYNRITDD